MNVNGIIDWIISNRVYNIICLFLSIITIVSFIRKGITTAKKLSRNITIRNILNILWYLFWALILPIVLIYFASNYMSGVFSVLVIIFSSMTLLGFLGAILMILYTNNLTKDLKDFDE